MKTWRIVKFENITVLYLNKIFKVLQVAAAKIKFPQLGEQAAEPEERETQIRLHKTYLPYTGTGIIKRCIRNG
jgi:hypothetical protein